jgi:hypothetical protein
MTTKSTKAPTLEEIEATAQLPEMHELEAKQPTLRVIGAGGCGTNLLKALLLARPAFDSVPALMTIDTSHSNAQALPKQIEVHSIGDLGSGKDRAKNVGAITKYLDNHKNFVSEAADITIILFSLAGGSGSVIAPLLAHRLMRHSERAVILIGVADASSKRDCMNTILTIKTLSKFATENNYYLPLMLYSNIEAGRVAVNRTITSRLIELIDMLTNKSITEIDYTDKLNYLRPTNVGCPAGCYLLSVSATDSDGCQDLPGEMSSIIGEGDMVHACIVVNDTGKCPKILTNVTYTGLAEKKKFFSTIGTAIPTELVNELNETAERYARNEVHTDNNNKTFDGVAEREDSSGIILE